MNLSARARWTALGILVGVFLVGVTASPALAEDRGKSGLPHGPGNPIARLQREIDTLTQQVADLQKQLAQMAKLGQDVTTLAQQVAALQQQVAGYQQQLAQMAKLGQDVTTLTQQVASLQQQLAALATLQQQVSGLSSQVTGLNGQVTSLNGQVTSLNGQVTSLGGQVTSVNGQVAGLGGQVTSLNGQVASLNNQIADLNARLQVSGSSSSLAVYDFHDTKIGDVVGVQDEIPWVTFTAAGQMVVLRVFSGHLVGGSVWFSDASCQGTPYISDPTFFTGADVFSVAAVREPGGVVYAAPPATPHQQVLVQSLAQQDATCLTFPSPLNRTLVPATLVTTLDLQFSRPYKVH